MTPNLLRLFNVRVAVTWLTMLVMMSFAQPASPDTVEFPLSVEFSGATPPAGAAPWLTATFDDQASSVLLSLDAAGLIDSEFVNVWYFNLDPLLDPTALVFGPLSKIGSFDDPIISTGVDLFQADGDGMFDIEFRFPNPDGGARRFGPGESMTTEITITGGATLTANSFDFPSEPDGGLSVLPTAAHVGGVGGGGNNSGWITTPEPSTFVLAVLGLLGLAFYGWHRRS